MKLLFILWCTKVIHSVSLKNEYLRVNGHNIDDSQNQRSQLRRLRFRRAKRIKINIEQTSEDNKRVTKQNSHQNDQLDELISFWDRRILTHSLYSMSSNYDEIGSLDTVDPLVPSHNPIDVPFNTSYITPSNAPVISSSDISSSVPTVSPNKMPINSSPIISNVPVNTLSKAPSLHELTLNPVVNEPVQNSDEEIGFTNGPGNNSTLGSAISDGIKDGKIILSSWKEFTGLVPPKCGFRREQDIFNLLTREVNFDVSNLHQVNAFQWIVDHDKLELCASDLPRILRRTALVALYFSTVGQNWSFCSSGVMFSSTNMDDYHMNCPNLSGKIYNNNTCLQTGTVAWLTPDVHECCWGGVYCGDSGLSTEIYLENNNLIGTIPSILTQIPDLQVLRLSNNLLGGALPKNFGSQTFYNISLGSNRFSSSNIPLQWPSSLKEIDLHNLDLNGAIPDAFAARYINLRKLYLQNNFFVGQVSKTFAEIKSLSMLNLQYNQFTGSVPQSICDLEELHEIIIDCDLIICSCCKACNG